MTTSIQTRILGIRQFLNVDKFSWDGPEAPFEKINILRPILTNLEINAQTATFSL